mgnify:CR=1 FL=1
MGAPEDCAYRDGWRDGMQRALDLVCKAADFVEERPDHPMAESLNVLTNLISSIQAEPEPKEY